MPLASVFVPLPPLQQSYESAHTHALAMAVTPSSSNTVPESVPPLPSEKSMPLVVAPDVTETCVAFSQLVWAL